MTTQGTLELTAHGWGIKAEPHIIYRLKRLFERVNQSTIRSAIISDTPETCFELRWFLQRYPLAMDTAAAERLAARARAYEERMASLDSMLTDQYVPQEFKLAIPLRPYQAFAADLALHSGALLVGDDVGLGKSAMAIGLITDPQTRPALVVTLTAVVTQWARELGRFAPDLTAHIIRTRRPYMLPEADVYLTNYEKLSGWGEALQGQVRAVIFDEAQELRRTGGSLPTQKYSAATRIASGSDYRMGLTATPVYNFGEEIFNVLNIIQPGCLGTELEFRRQWCRRDEPRVVEDPDRLGAYLRDQGLMIRRTRVEVGRQLPPVSTAVHYVDADLNELEVVAKSADDLAAKIVAAGGADGRFQASGEFSHLLRQATGVSKAPSVAAFVKILLDQGERVVLYGWHRKVYEIWEQYFAAYEPGVITGEQDARQKDVAKARFLEARTPLLIISLRAGAGIDGLQSSCRTIVFGELDWSPYVHLQNIGRVWRDGQTEPVIAYFLVADVGADPTMLDTLGLKHWQGEGIRNPLAHEASPLDQTVDDTHVRRLAEDYLRQRRERTP